FQQLYSHEEIGVERTYARDRAVADWCDGQGIRWQQLRQTGVFRALKDRDRRAKLWREFTFDTILPIPERKDLRRIVVPKAWRNLVFAERQQFRLRDTQHIFSDLQRSSMQPVTEADARATLQSFLYERGLQYRGGISSPNTAFTAGSRLSVHLAWGTLTGRSVYQATQARKEELKDSEESNAGRWRSSLTSFLSRLHWRDHFIQRLETEPQMEFEPLNPAYTDLEYQNRQELLQRWVEGTTGFPMVDACIRCLRTTGFVNFRMRAMLTSIACHTLQIHWKKIDHPMARMYTDYEPGIHLSQLQMQASVVGINSIRMYSPHKQIVDQDPDTLFIKKWIPELRDFDAKTIIAHRGTPLGDYPAQPLDWWQSSRDMRSKIWAIRKQEKTKAFAKLVYEKHGSRRRPGRRRSKKETA
ncbi:MAG: FAD-binding domain-containing protein, partial [Bacteroidota bacterium]